MNTLKLLPFLAIGGLFCLSPLSLRADDHDHDDFDDDDSVWEVTIGAGVEFEPVSPGIGKYTTEPLPWIDITYRDRYYLSVERGLGATVYKDERFSFDLALDLEFGRDEEDAPVELKGMGNIDEAGVLVATLGYQAGPYELELEFGQQLGGTDGWRARLSVEREWDLGGGHAFSVSPYLDIADSKTMRAWYGVDAAQSLRSGRAQYRPGSGLERCGVELMLMRRFGEHWGVAASVDVGVLLGDAKKSPLTTKDSQVMGARLGVLYRF